MAPLYARKSKNDLETRPALGGTPPASLVPAANWPGRSPDTFRYDMADIEDTAYDGGDGALLYRLAGRVCRRALRKTNLGPYLPPLLNRYPLEARLARKRPLSSSPVAPWESIPDRIPLLALL